MTMSAPQEFYRAVVEDRLADAGALVVEHTCEPALLFTITGPHALNPYHNNQHMMLVAYHCMAAANYMNLDIESRTNLITAAALHDYGHSGGVYAHDRQNIEVAVRGVEQLARRMEVTRIHRAFDTDVVSDLIRVTEYDAPNQQFTHAPVSVMQQVLRDADLCMIYSNEGRALICDLWREVYRNKPQMDLPVPEPLRLRRATALDNALGSGMDHLLVDTGRSSLFWIWYAEQVLRFQKSMPMHSEYGRMMREQHLDRSLYYLAQDLYQRLCETTRAGDPFARHIKSIEDFIIYAGNLATWRP